MKRIRIILWFVVRNLFRRGRVAATVISSLGIMLLTLIALLGLGVLHGYQLVERARLQKDPLTHCLWLGHPAHRETWFTDKRLAQLAEVLKKVPEVKEWYPCREVRLDWFLLSEPDYSISLVGRTFLPNDPVSRVLPQAAAAASSLGVYVTSEFLTTLGKKEEDPLPEELAFRNLAGDLQKTKIAGILDQELPWRHRFLVEEGWYAEFVKKRPNVQAKRIRTGPLPAGWPESGKQLPEFVRSAFSKLQLLSPMGTRDEEERWVWEVRTWGDVEYSLSDWSERLGKIVSLMEANGFAITPSERQQFLRLEPLDISATEIEEATPYHFVVLYVPDLGHLKQVKAKLEAAGFVVRDPAYTIHRLDELGKRSASLSRVLAGIVGLLGASLFAMLASLQAMRTEVRRREIAILKALGMSNTLAATILLGEAAIIWAYSAAIGWAVAWPLGRFAIGPSLVAAEKEFATLCFVIPAMELIGVALVILVLSLATVLGAAWSAFITPPMRDLPA